MSLIDAIKTHLSETPADPIDWETVAATLSAPIPQLGAKASSKRTFAALVNGGLDPDKIIAGFTATPSGAALIAKLNADPDGIDWSDSLTNYILTRIVAAGGDVTAEVGAVGLIDQNDTMVRIY